MKFCVLLVVLLSTVASSLAHSTATPDDANPMVSSSGDLSFHVGMLYIDNVDITGTDEYEEFTANAWVNYTDASGNVLKFDVTGKLDKGDHSLFSFAGTQKGTWTLNADITLDFLTISYTNSPRDGHISGGYVLGKLSLEADIDFLSLKEAALGFVVTSQDPSFNDLPNAPQAFGELNSLINVGVVLSTFAGPFKFTSGAAVDVTPGINFFAASIFHDVQVTWHGTCHFSGGFGCTITADAADFNLGPGLEADNTEIVVQFPTSPSLSMQTDLTWTSLNSLHLVGEISTTEVHFQGTSSLWNIPLGGSSPLVVTDLDIDLTFTFASASSEAVLQGTMTWPPSLTNPLAVTMKYPADSAHPHCVSLTADLTVATAEGLTLDALAEHAAAYADAGKHSPSQASGLFGTSLQEVELSAYPGCGAFFVKGVANTKGNFGQVDVEFALYNSQQTSEAVAAVATSLSPDPEVNVMGVTTTTASDVLNTVAATMAESGIALPFATTYGGGARDVVAAAKDICHAMRLPLLVDLTAFRVTVNCTYALALVEAAMAAADAEAFAAPIGDHLLRTHLTSSDDEANWLFMASIKTNNVTWPLDNPPQVLLTVPSFAVASGSFMMTVGTGSIIAEEGLNFVAELDVDKTKAPSFDPLKEHASAECLQKTFMAQGSITQSNFFLQAQLADGCVPVDGGSILLTSTSIRISSPDFALSLATGATLVKVQNLGLQLTGDFSTSGLELSGASTSVYDTKIGDEPLQITSMSASLSVSFTPAGFSGSLSGAIVLNATEEIAVSASIDTQSASLSFSGSIHEDKPVSLGPLMAKFIGQKLEDKIPLPQSIKDDILTVYFVSAELTIATNPPSFSGQGEVICFIEADVTASISFGADGFHFGISLQKAPSPQTTFSFSKLLKQYTSLDALHITYPTFALATSAAVVAVPGIPYEIKAGQGFTFGGVATMDITKPVEGLVAKLHAGNGTLVVAGTIDPAGLSFKLAASETMKVPLSKGVDLDSTSVYIAASPTSFTFGAEADVHVTLATAQELTFSGGLDISAAGVAASITMTGDWNKPFGLHDVVVHSPSLSLGISPVLVLDQFGLAAQASIGSSITATVDIFTDVADITHSVLGLDFDDDSFSALATTVGDVPEDAISHTAGGIKLKELKLSVNPSLTPVTYQGVTFPPGIDILVQDLSVGPIVGDADIQLDPTKGIKLMGEVQPFSLGKILALKAAKLDVEVMVGSPCGFGVQGDVVFLGVECASNVSITDAGVSVSVLFSSGPVTAVLTLVSADADPWNPTDFAVHTEFHEDFKKWLSDNLPQHAQKSLGKWGEQIKDQQSKLDSTVAHIKDLQQKCDAQKAEDQKRLDQAAKAVDDAKNSVDSAKAKVDGLKAKINSAKEKLSKCSKWDVACKAKYGEQVAQYESEKTVADTALSAASQVLQAAEDALKKLPTPVTDPQVLAWQAEILADQGYIATYNATLKQLSRLVGVAQKTVSEGSSSLVSKSLALKDGSWTKMSAGTAAGVTLTGSFLGQDVSTSVPMVMNNSDGFVENVWNDLSNIASNWEASDLDNTRNAVQKAITSVDVSDSDSAAVTPSSIGGGWVALAIVAALTVVGAVGMALRRRQQNRQMELPLLAE